MSEMLYLFLRGRELRGFLFRVNMGPERNIFDVFLP